LLLHTCNTTYYPLHGSEGQGSWFFAAIQYQEGTSTLAKNYHLALFNVTADSATDVGADTKVDLIDVEDNANNIALNIADLHALGSKLSDITLTPDEPIQITQEQKTAYQTTLDKVLGGVDIDIV
jgi:hypothetical protein